MSITLNCPACGKHFDLDGSLAGKKARCSGCGQVFRVPGSPASSEHAKSQGSGRSRSSKSDEPRNRPDQSWLEDGAESSGLAPPPIRRTPTTISRRSGNGISQGLLLGLISIGLVVVGVVVGLLVTSPGSGVGAKPAPAENQEKHQTGSDMQPARNLTDRILRSVTGGSNPLTDVASYPQIGPLLPPCLPPPPLRDVSAHERQTRAMIGYLGRMNDVLASVHDVASMKAAGEQLKNLAQQMGTEMRQNAPAFRLTPAEDTEVTRRVAGDLRREIDRFRQQSVRISTLPGLGLAGVQLVSLVTRLSLPMEMALKRAEGVKPRTGPEPYAEVYVQLASGDDEIVFRQKLRSLLDRVPGIQSTIQGETRRASYRVWPVDDVGAFAQDQLREDHGERPQHLRGRGPCACLHGRRRS